MNIYYTFDEHAEYTTDQIDKIISFSDSSSFSYTFWQHVIKLPNWYSDTGLDLLHISLAVYAADRLCLRSDAHDAWSRSFVLYVPVLNIDIWRRNEELLNKTLSFLSGDKWRFVFRARQYTDLEKRHKRKWEKSKQSVRDYDQVCMFSGGLDSFVGAIDLLQERTKRTLFVSHYGGGKGTKEYQDRLKEKFIARFSLDSSDFVQFYAKVVAGGEDTTRTRSFMFFSHAIALATALSKEVNLIIPENGLISLNIPLTYSRLGTSSTRTTHPHYMALLQELLTNIGISVHMSNPYQFKTKGEMLVDCKDQEFMRANLSNTMSCSHPDIGRMSGEREAKHCGYCLPCVVRLAAIKRAGITDTSTYRDERFQQGATATEIFNSYRLGIARFNPRYAFLTIQQSGSVTHNIDAFTQLYIRGMNEIKEYIEEHEKNVSS